MKHTYPPSYKPGPKAHWTINRAWEILDHVKPGVIPEEVRAYLAGAISGLLGRYVNEFRGNMNDQMARSTKHRPTKKQDPI